MRIMPKILSIGLLSVLLVGCGKKDKSPKYSVEINTNNNYGTVEGNGKYKEGTNVTIAATPIDGYEFIGWYKDGSYITNDSPYSFTMTSENISYTAMFQKDIFDYNTSKDTILRVKPYAVDITNGHDLYDIPSEIIIPEYVKNINSYTFVGFDITSIKLSSNLEAIEDGTFFSCSKLKEIEIPNSVTSIGSFAFKGCSSLSNISMPNSVKSIGESAFEDCLNLKETEIPNGVTYIGRNAFSNCGIASITIPDSVTEIGSMALGAPHLVEVYNLSNIDIQISQYSQTYMPYYTLVVHTSLDEKSIMVQDNGFVFAYYDNKGYLVTYQGENENISLPSSFTYDGQIIESYEIYYGAFSNNSIIENVEVPTSVTGIYEQAFISCSNLKNVTFLGDGATFINARAFSYCKELKSINLPNSLTTIGENAFAKCDKLESITIPDNITIIEPATFDCCISLKNVVFGNKVEYVYSIAFRYCPNLLSIVIPSSMKGIAPDAFQSTKIIEIYNLAPSLDIDLNQVFPLLIAVHTSLDEESILSTFGDYVCAYYENTGYLVYYTGTNKNVTLPNSISFNNLEVDNYKLHGTFRDNITIEKVVIPNSVTSIDDYTFCNCMSLKEINIPNSVAKIGNCAFLGCEVIEEIVIPSSVTTIGYAAFSACFKLAEITIPDNVNYFYTSTCHICDSLGYIILPTSITTIDLDTNFEKHISIFYKGTIDQFNDITIKNPRFEQLNATIYYYAEEKPSSEGNYWHYRANNIPTIWTY